MGSVIAFPARFDEHGHAWEPWCSEAAVARHYGVTTRTVRRWRRAGAPSRRVEGSRRYRLSEVDRWLSAREDGS